MSLIEPHKNLLMGSHKALGVVRSDLCICLCGYDLEKHNLRITQDTELIILKWHDPADDSQLPARLKFREAHRLADLMVDRIQMGQKVLVTCWSGKNRSGLLTALAMKRLGYSGLNAVAKILSLKSDALSNDDFMAEIIKE